MRSKAPRRGSVLLLLALSVIFFWSHISGTAGQHSQGSPRVYPACIDRAVLAITNAFSSYRYHDMAFIAVPVHYDASAERWSETPATNEWILYSVDTPLRVVAK